MCVVELMWLYRMEKRVPENKLKFERIVVHCSDSPFGTSLMIAEWHKARKWKTIGYHAVVQNGYPTASWWDTKKKIPFLEGAVEVGRPIDNDEFFEDFEMGAHVRGHNVGSFGICMIGEKEFTDKVLNVTLDVVSFYLKQFKLTASSDTVKGHYELDVAKTCPNINMDIFREHLVNGTYYGEKVNDKPTPKPGKTHTEGLGIVPFILKFIFKRKEK